MTARAEAIRPDAQSDRARGALCGLGAAALFGVSTPLAKILLPNTGPLLLAGLLYLGGGLGVLAASLVQRPGQGGREAQLRKADLANLLGIIALGGIAGPVLMLYGLERVSGVAGSLLLNLEAPFTMVLAVVFFKEHLGVRGMLAALLVVGGAAILGYSPDELRAQSTGALAIAGACLSWAIDNNLTQRLSLRDPIVVVRIKALGAGSCTLAIALVTGERLPRMEILAPALVVGVACFGISIVLDMYALRILGAAREAAFFARPPSWARSQRGVGCERAQEGGRGEKRRLACGTKDTQRIHVEHDADSVTGNADDECWREDFLILGSLSPVTSAMASVQLPAPRALMRTTTMGSRNDRRWVRLLSIAQLRHAPAMASAPWIALEAHPVSSRGWRPLRPRVARRAFHELRGALLKNTTARTIVNGASRLRRREPATPETRSRP